MSLEHKRPLFAFAVVVIACVAILVNAIRSEALVSFLRSEASHVVAGLPFGEAPHEPGRRLSRATPLTPGTEAEAGPAAEVVAEVAVEAPQVAAPVQQDQAAQTAQPVRHGHQQQGHAQGHPLGHHPGRHLGHARGHEKEHGLRGHAQARGHAHAARAHVRDGQGNTRGLGDRHLLARPHAHLHGHHRH